MPLITILSKQTVYEISLHRRVLDCDNAQRIQTQTKEDEHEEYWCGK